MASEHRWVVDSLEEGVARIEEDGARMITLPRYLLPDAVKEGQVVRVTWTGENAGNFLRLEVAIDDEATSAALERSRSTMAAAMKASKARDPGGDVSL